jgi:hypothetical protein
MTVKLPLPPVVLRTIRIIWNPNIAGHHLQNISATGRSLREAASLKQATTPAGSRAAHRRKQHNKKGLSGIPEGDEQRNIQMLNFWQEMCFLSDRWKLGRGSSGGPGNQGFYKPLRASPSR